MICKQIKVGKMEILDVNKICRICLEENELNSLFESTIEPTPFEMIINFANIQVSFSIA